MAYRRDYFVDNGESYFYEDQTSTGPTLTDLLMESNKEYERMYTPYQFPQDPTPPIDVPLDQTPPPFPEYPPYPFPQDPTPQDPTPPVHVSPDYPPSFPPQNPPPKRAPRPPKKKSPLLSDSPWPHPVLFLGPLTPHTTPQDLQNTLQVPLTKTSILQFDPAPFAMLSFQHTNDLKTIKTNLKSQPLLLTDTAGNMVPLQLPEQPLFKASPAMPLTPCMFEGRIIMVESIVHLSSAIQTLLSGPIQDFNQSNQITIGLDTEWKPNFKSAPNPTSLLQLASPEVVVLIRVHLLAREFMDYSTLLQDLLAIRNNIPYQQQMEQEVKREQLAFYARKLGKVKPTQQRIKNIERTFESQYPDAPHSGFTLPTVLYDLLTCPYIHKVGLELHHDIQKLSQDLRCSLPVRSCHDIKTHPLYAISEQKSLAGLAAVFLHYELSKKARLTNWEHPFLSKTQIKYAATDAWISLQVFNEMHRQFIICDSCNF